jgi:ABC-type Fe3+-hydroxamate transport system substrate-binding protein
LSGESRPKQEEVVSAWQNRRSLKAVSSGHVYAIPSSPFLVPGPRAIEAAKMVMKLIHPELRQ